MPAAVSDRDLSKAVWRASSYSNGQGGDACVEVADNLPAPTPFPSATARAPQARPFSSPPTPGPDFPTESRSSEGRRLRRAALHQQ
jgi:hypothetical protein